MSYASHLYSNNGGKGGRPKSDPRRTASVLDAISMFNKREEENAELGGDDCSLVGRVARKDSSSHIKINKEHLPDDYNPKLGRGLSFELDSDDEASILPDKPLNQVETKIVITTQEAKDYVKEEPKPVQRKATTPPKRKPYREAEESKEPECPLNIIPGIPLPGDSLKKDPLGSLKVDCFEDVYVLTDELNSGAFGTVWKGYHISSGPQSEVAIKVVERIDKETDDDVLNETHTLKEIRTLPNITRLFDFYMDDERMYVVQELAGGGDVFDRLIEKTTYTESDARDLCRVLLTTMKALHGKEIIHRDLKPENLLLKNMKSDTNILLCDFGFARLLPEDGTGCMTNAGTPMFTAPEIVNAVEYRAEVDMWSIGCIIFMLLGGYQPFDSDSDEETYAYISAGDWGFDDDVWEGVSEEAQSLIEELLTLDSDKRLTADQALSNKWFTSCRKFKLQKNDLSQVVEGAKKYNETVRKEDAYIDRKYVGDDDYLYYDPWKYVNEEAAKRNWLRPLGLHFTD